VKPNNLAHDRLVLALVTDLLHNIQTISGAHSASCTVGTKVASPEVKWQGHEVDHSPPANAEVKNGGTISLLPIRLLSDALLIKAMGNFTVAFT
jgi:hypothetical protein